MSQSGKDCQVVSTETSDTIKNLSTKTLHTALHESINEVPIAAHILHGAMWLLCI